MPCSSWHGKNNHGLIKPDCHERDEALKTTKESQAMKATASAEGIPAMVNKLINRAEGWLSVTGGHVGQQVGT